MMNFQSSWAMLILFLTLLFTFTCGYRNEKPYLNYSGDIMLGGLFPIHKNGARITECGEIQVSEGMQMVESMLYAVQQINKNPSILPGVTLGVLAFDTCESPTYALEQSLVFIKGFIAHNNEYHNMEFQCKDGTAPRYKEGSFDQVVAIIGGQSSAVTIQVASMMRLFDIPIISYMATSPALSDEERFPSFFRTVPSDNIQAHAMLELLKKFNWTYVSIVHSDTEYGTYGYDKLKQHAPDYGICFATPLRVRSDEDYEKAINSLANNSDSRVVVVFAEQPTVVLRLAEIARNQGLGDRYAWVGSHGWSVAFSHKLSSRSIRDNSAGTAVEIANQEVLEGALAMQPLAAELRGFDDYFTSLKLSTHQHINPWFKEYWEAFFHCKHADKFDNDTRKFKGNICDETLKIDINAGYKQHTVLHFVRDAVYSVAQALHNMRKDYCPNVTGLCYRMKHIDGNMLKKYISDVNFNDDRGNPFRFLNGRDGPPRYSILNLQRTQNNTFQWMIVGNYTLNEHQEPVIHIDHNILKYKNGKDFPKSSCNQECEPDQIKVREYEDTCCWSCEYCAEFEIRKDDFHCVLCPRGYKATPNKTTCEAVPEEYISYNNPWAIAALTVASFGIVATISVSYIFWSNSDTPVIKASGRELSYLLLLGTFLEFSVTFVMVAPPTELTCGMTKFFFGFCFTLCYAAIVTKTNRIARIFNSSIQKVHKRFTSPQSQLLITGLLTSVEILINTAWLIMDPPKVIQVLPAQDQRLKICSGLGDFSYIISLSYPFILIGICTAYAFKTRKCPEGFNEARHIAFTNYTAIIIWIAFVPLYLASTNNAVCIVTLAMSLSVSGLVQLCCLFLPKIYIVIFTPEKNTKEVVMAHSRTYSVSSPNSASTPFDSNTYFSSNNGYIHGYRNNSIFIKSSVPRSVPRQKITSKTLTSQ